MSFILLNIDESTKVGLFHIIDQSPDDTYSSLHTLICEMYRLHDISRISYTNELKIFVNSCGPGTSSAPFPEATMIANNEANIAIQEEYIKALNQRPKEIELIKKLEKENPNV